MESPWAYHPGAKRRFLAREEVDLLNGPAACRESLAAVLTGPLPSCGNRTAGFAAGISVIVEAGVRNASLLVRIDGQSSAIRLGQRLAARINVMDGPHANAAAAIRNEGL